MRLGTAVPPQRSQSDPDPACERSTGPVHLGSGCSERVPEASFRQSFDADWSGILEERTPAIRENRAGPPAFALQFHVQQLQLLQAFAFISFAALFLRVACARGGFRVATGPEGPPSRPPALPAPGGAKRLYGERDCGTERKHNAPEVTRQIRKERSGRDDRANFDRGCKPTTEHFEIEAADRGDRPLDKLNPT